jgi:hypothetical protein
MPKLVIIRTNGSVESRSIDSPPDHTALQQAVGGWIEMIPLFNQYSDEPCVAFCDEEGKLKGKVKNERADKLWKSQLPYRSYPDHLVGDIAIVVGDRKFLGRM